MATSGLISHSSSFQAAQKWETYNVLLLYIFATLFTLQMLRQNLLRRPEPNGNLCLVYLVQSILSTALRPGHRGYTRSGNAINVVPIQRPALSSLQSRPHFETEREWKSRSWISRTLETVLARASNNLTDRQTDLRKINVFEYWSLHFFWTGHHVFT
jgi:hypothetical protein